MRYGKYTALYILYVEDKDNEDTGRLYEVHASWFSVSIINEKQKGGSMRTTVLPSTIISYSYGLQTRLRMRILISLNCYFVAWSVRGITKACQATGSMVGVY